MLSKAESRLKSGEVRPAAILFLDVVGYSTISRQLDPEQLAALMDSSFRIFELTAKSCGGYLDKVIGDAALYVFAGHPHYAPPCEAALAAALRIQDRARQISRSLADLKLSLPVRCGVSFGEVAKQVVGGEEAQVTVMGDTVNLAQRLEAAAEPGTVLTHEAVIAKAGAIFSHTSIGRHELKGVGTHELFEVTSRVPQQAILRGSRAELSPFVGREAQLQQARATVESWLGRLATGKSAAPAADTDAAAPSARLLVIQGEQAVGKSRFALELVRSIPATLPPGQCLAHATAHCSAYASPLSITAELARVAGLSAANLAERWEALCRLAAERFDHEYAERQRRHLPLLAYVLEAPDIDTSGIRQSSPQSFETGCRLALRACCELADLDDGQVVLVVEDLQWLGGLGGLLTDVLSLAKTSRPVIVIGTARMEFESAEPQLDALLGIEQAFAGDDAGAAGNGAAGSADSELAAHAVIRLPLLSAEQGQLLVARLLPGVVLPVELEAELHEKAAGLPYYYEEFARMLADSGMLQAAGDPAERAAGGRLVLGEAAAGLAMPDDIRMLLLGRLDLLATRSKELAMRASVLGRSFSPELLRRVDARLELGSGEWLPAGLAELEQAGILAIGEAHDYFFEHIMTREAAYDSLLKQNRRLVHGATADVLAEGLVAGSPEERDLLPQLIDHLERSERFWEAHDRCCELMIILAQSGRTEHWEKWDERARELRANAAALQGEPGAVDGAAESALYLRAVGIKKLMQGELEEAKADFDTALSFAGEAADYESVARLLANKAIVAHREGDFAEARDQILRAIEISESRNLNEICGTLYANLGKYEFDSGNHDAALKFYEHARELHVITGNNRGLATVLVNLGAVLRNAGRISEAHQCISDALELSRSLLDRLLECSAWTNLGALLHREGKLEQAKHQYETALKANFELKRPEWTILNLHNLGEVAFDLGALEESERRYRAALDLAQRTNSQRYLVLVSCGLGRTLAALKQFDSAHQHLEYARGLAESQTSPMTAGVVDGCYSFLYLQQGNLKQAQEFLASARECARQYTLLGGSQLGDEINRVESAMADLQSSSVSRAKSGGKNAGSSR